MFLLWFTVAAIALSATTAKDGPYQTLVYKGNANRTIGFQGLPEKSYINEGQCTGYLSVPECSVSKPRAVRVTVLDFAPYANVSVEPDLSSVYIYRSAGRRGRGPPCKGRAAVILETACV